MEKLGEGHEDRLQVRLVSRPETEDVPGVLFTIIHAMLFSDKLETR